MDVELDDVDEALVDWKGTAENLQRRVTELEQAARAVVLSGLEGPTEQNMAIGRLALVLDGDA